MTQSLLLFQLPKSIYHCESFERKLPLLFIESGDAHFLQHLHVAAKKARNASIFSNISLY